MREPDEPSERLVEQRMRNRAMESLETLSEGDEGVRIVGVGEYVNQFFDFIDDDIPWRWREWSTFMPDEVACLDEVHGLLKEACRQTPRDVTDVDFIASGWPERIQPAAQRALSLMTARGRFSEAVEEDQPTGHHG
ncbi:hypothetical protein ACFWQC_03075 [Nocardioides sp. NPDC058538]|uniref:hypothetical protein n=1 Tax=Nocardioides sp. NPDC058538 TaxID=3346542 RepID=UPI0036694F37